MKKFKPLLKAAGITQGLTAKDLKELNDKYAALAKAIKELAPTLKSPKGKRGGFYGISRVKKGLKQAHPGVKIYKVYLDTGKWRYSLTKNLVGVPVERTKFIWALYKVKGEPLCQLKSVGVYEQLKGPKKYAKNSGIRWGRVRFQQCK